jgi:hypothetical protein
MGNEEDILHFRLIHISVYVNQAWVVNGISGLFRFGWAVSLTGRNRTECTMEDRKTQQTAKDGQSRRCR